MWLTVQPFPAMVDVAAHGAPGWRRSAAPPTPSPPPRSSSPRRRAAAPRCWRPAAPATPLWRCIGDHAGAPWTDIGGDAGVAHVRPSLGRRRDARPPRSASFAAAVAGYFGTPAITRSAWEADPAFMPWLRRLAGAVSPSALSAGTPLATMATRAGALDIAATTDAEVARPRCHGRPIRRQLP